mgnify:CR=1
MNQSEILSEILDLDREICRLQEETNRLVFINRELPDKHKDKDFTESIESYFTYDL